VPAKVNPQDWDRLFRAGAPRRGGPLRVLANVLIFGTVLGLLAAGAFYGLRFGSEQIEQSALATQAAIETQNVLTLATRTSRALETVTAEAIAAATPTAAPEVILGNGSVVAGGNLRNAPSLAPETIIGQICPGDQVVFLEQREVEASLWYRIRVVQTGPNCAAQQVTVGSSGWASNTLLTSPAP
jgi:hypothetical protein